MTIKANVTITTPFIEICGGGKLDGNITVHSNVNANLFTKIHDIIFYNTSEVITDGKTAINLGFATDVYIYNNQFEYYDKAIYVMPIDASQHSNSNDIHHNIFNHCNYGLYVDNPIGAVHSMPFADSHFTSNHLKSIYKSGIYANGIDGLVCTSNTFCLIPGQVTGKQYNIYILNGSQIHISDNNLFESGLENIFLEKASSFVISDNALVQNGVMVNASAILIKNNQSDGNRGVIKGNTIYETSKYAIELIGDNSFSISNIVIDGNFMRGIGDLVPPSDDTGITHYAIYVSDNYPQILVNNNMSAYNDNYYSTAIFYNNIELTKYRTFSGAKSYSGTGTVVDVSQSNRLHLSSSSGGTIDTINGGADGKILYVLNFSNAVTLVNNNGIKLKGGVNASIPNVGAITLVYSSNIWWEVGRSF
jgi:hypothetical protein